MAFDPDQIAALGAPLDRGAVKSREQAGRTLSYVEAYHCENEANRIFGFDAWDRETELTLITEAVVGDKHRVYYRAKVRITVRTPDGGKVIREGCGYGSGIDKDLGQAHESALKEAESDAEKRALKTFGNPFGQALYDKGQTQVADAPPPPPKVNLAVTAAMTAITVCDTIAELKAWHMKNADHLATLTEAEQDQIARHFKTRAKAVAPLKDETFRGGSSGGVSRDHGDDPFHDDKSFEPLDMESR